MRKHSPWMSSNMQEGGRVGMVMPLMAAASPMISLKRSAIRRGFSRGTTMETKALESETLDAELAKTSS